MADYQITIQASGLGGAAPADGFIDNQNIKDYMAANGTPPASLANAKAKARAYARYKLLVISLCQFSSTAGPSSITATGATIDTAATAFQFTVHMDDLSKLVTRDEQNAGQTLTGLAAIKRVVARSLIAAQMSYRFELYDPTLISERQTDGQATTQRPHTTSIIMDNVGALAASITAAETAITVTAL